VERIEQSAIRPAGRRELSRRVKANPPYAGISGFADQQLAKADTLATAILGG
jgi:hypothetical protein